ncbi:MAG: hypothetical protein DDT33_00717 [Firmicutes bacterium]|nr:hypothetical protein [Bacillota bacterium]
MAIHHRLREYLPEDLLDILWIFNWESTTPNYEKILQFGLKGIIEDVRERKTRLDREYMAETINGVDFVKGKDFLDSVIIALNAVIKWSKRYAKVATEMSKMEEHAGEKAGVGNHSQNLPVGTGEPRANIPGGATVFLVHSPYRQFH